MLGLGLLTGAGGDFHLNGDGVVFLCACSFAIHILVTSRAVAQFNVGALVAVQLSVCGLFCFAFAAFAGESLPRSAIPARTLPRASTS